MNLLRRHLALIIPLLALLFSLESIMLVNRAVNKHENKLSDNYSIVIASKNALTLDKIQNFIREAKEVKAITPDYMMNELKKDLSRQSLETLQRELPFFYSLKLSIFPDEERLQKINATLSKLSGVTKVESFTKSHSQVYKLLLITKTSIVVFASLIAILSYILMIKQIEIWKFEHSDRMEIMAFLGAPAWMRNSILFRLAFVDSIISTIAIITGMAYLINHSKMQEILTTLEVTNDIFRMGSDFIILLFTSIFASIISVVFVIIKQKDL
ncbi:cell division FtsX domain-containing protein [Helicobacter marmotae]|uniref:Cell division protein FtsX n=1 Tax=Helicobacter marmotae TaxID=152490 RepID=A0A3D8I8X9_9HELI|nr:cell division protein FtsX [Helicobacter marmotae]RDU61001.1 cell division protein FtsX [Helicobacter marmotae]